MRMTACLLTGAMVLLLSFASAYLPAAGLIPDRAHQITITGRFADQSPSFFVILSSEPLRDSRGRPQIRISARELTQFTPTPGRVGLRLGGKTASAPGKFEYHFGPGVDAKRPWNSGSQWDWRYFQQVSPDIWDHVYLLAMPELHDGKAAGADVVQSVTIRINGQLLYDSSASESMPNKRPIRLAFEPVDLTPQTRSYPILDLSQRMSVFRDRYYEINGNPLLTVAYADLGQTEETKYAKSGESWASKFVQFVYQGMGLVHPGQYGRGLSGDAKKRWKRLGAAERWAELGVAVYPSRIVATWSDDQKVKMIRPGSFVRLPKRQRGRPVIFTTWVRQKGKPITKYAAISGDTKGMVFPRKGVPVTVNDGDAFFAVPVALHQLSVLEPPGRSREKSADAPPERRGGAGEVVAKQPPEKAGAAPREPAESQYRTWTDHTGQFSVTAVFVRFESGKIKLRKKDGEEVEVDPGKLSDADKESLRRVFRGRGVRPPF